MAVLTAEAMAQSHVLQPSSPAQLASIQKQWTAVQLQQSSVQLQWASARKHRELTVPVPAPAPAPALASNLNCLPVPPASLASMIRRTSARHGLQPALIEAVVRQESGGSPCAVSPKGAMGLMQLMPATAGALGVFDPFEPEANLEAGARFLRGLLDRYNGSLPLALGAYNAGPRRVDDAGGVPGIAETQAYVRNVLSRAGLPVTASGSPDWP